MPDPSSANATQVNYELGVANTTQLQLSNNWVQNVASIRNDSPENATNYGRLRWGINFPGRLVSPFLEQANYENTSNADISSSFLGAESQDNEAVAANYLSLYANGVLRYYSTAGSDAAPADETYFHRTWLTSGLNSDYTANFNVDSGTANTGSNSINTDLALSTNREWFVYAYTSAPGPEITQEVYGNLIIKTGGTEIFRRRFALSAIVEIQSGL